MHRINYEYFTERWLERAEREENASIDIGDKFISLWIAFNGWMKFRFGEPVKDATLITHLKKFQEIRNVFNQLQRRDETFISNLQELRRYAVLDMRYADDVSRSKIFDGTFESLIDAIYQVRCNLFHGRKGDEEKDIRLISLSYDILLPLFKKYLELYEQR